MLEGLDANRIIVGAYVDSDGGVCPMLAAHRNGGRTALASFARAWDRYTYAHKGARQATPRELTTLRFMLETSLIGEGHQTELAAAVADLKAAKLRRAREAGVLAAAEPAETTRRDNRRARPHARTPEAPRLGLAAHLPPLRHVQSGARRARGQRLARPRARARLQLNEVRRG